ncbi:MAG TPA: MATE family efflux transporter [Thermotogota bacterium]|nr:MATE family efflux transporter [Thermotogota bacterium]
MNEMRMELLRQNPWKLMFKLCIPSIIGMLVIGLYSFMDAIFVGQMIGTSAMGAVSVAYPFTLFNSGIATLVGIGSASVLSRAVGKKDTVTVNKIMGNLIVLVAILSAVVTAVGMIFTRQLLMLSGAEGEILNLAEKYLRVIFIGSLFVNFAQSANMVMRGEGIMKKAMSFMMIGAILNIALDPLMILSFGDNGILGAAAATVISQITQAIITLLYFVRKSKTIRIHKVRLERSLLPQIFSIGFSAMLMQVMSFVQQTLLYNAASRYGGDTQIILIGAALRLQMFSFIPLWGMSQGLQPAVGTNYGAGDYERVKKITNVFLISSTMLAMFFWIPIELFPSTFLGLFIKDTTIVSEGIESLRLIFCIFPSLGMMIMGLTFFQAIGSAKKASILVLLRQIAIFIPMVLLLPRLMGISGVWMASPITDFVVFVLTLALLIGEYRKFDTIKKKREFATE